MIYYLLYMVDFIMLSLQIASDLPIASTDRVQAIAVVLGPLFHWTSSHIDAVQGHPLIHSTIDYSPLVQINTY